MEELPQKVIEMSKWPHTPSQRRLKDAMTFHRDPKKIAVEFASTEPADITPQYARRTLQAAQDDTQLLILAEEERWQKWAKHTYHSEAAARGENLENSLSIITAIAARGDEDETMGLAVIFRTTEQARKTGDVSMSIARMLRREEWMGFCLTLREVNGLAAVVIESKKNPGRISHIVCIPADLMEEDGDLPPEVRRLRN